MMIYDKVKNSIKITYGDLKEDHADHLKKIISKLQKYYSDH